MQSLNNSASSSSSVAKSSAALALFGGTGAAPRGNEGGANFAQMLRDTAHATAPAAPAVPAPAASPAPAEPAGAAARQESSATAKNEADATKDSQAAATDEREASEASEAASSKSARSDADQQTRKTRRAAQERDQAANRQAESRQAAQAKTDKTAAPDAGASEISVTGTEDGDSKTAADADASTTPLAAQVLALLQHQQPAPSQAKGQPDEAAAAKLAGAAGLPNQALGAAGKADAKALPLQATDGKSAAKGLSIDAADTQSRGETLKLAEAVQSFQTELHQAQAGAAAQGPAAAAVANKGSAEAGSAEKPRVAMDAPMDSPQFAPEMAARVSVLAADGVQQAELHLNPAEMGPVSVQIVVDGQQAQVSFVAEQGQTRSALEASLPDLASALREQGLTLAGGGVFQQSPGNSRGERDTTAGDGENRRSDTAVERAMQDNAVAAVGSPTRRAARGVVDLYA
jgi:flagellar hook-length control protein FliK